MRSPRIRQRRRAATYQTRCRPIGEASMRNVINLSGVAAMAMLVMIGGGFGSVRHSAAVSGGRWVGPVLPLPAGTERGSERREPIVRHVLHGIARTRHELWCGWPRARAGDSGEPTLFPRHRHGPRALSRQSATRTAKSLIFQFKVMVGTTGIEPVTPAMSRRCSPAELRALDG